MDVKYLITINGEGAAKSVQVFDDSLHGLGKTSETTEKTFGSLAKQFAIGDLLATGAKKAISFLWNEIKALPAAAMEAEKAQKALDAALEITGRNIPGLAQHFKDYADALMNQTIYDDEAIKGAQALLVQLTNLDKNGIDKATKGAIGLASVFGMDLESAAQLVAKSMNGNTAMLGRYGIKVTETTDKEKQRTEILTKLETFYGRAIAQTETYGGKLTQLKNTYGEIQEAVGTYIIKNHALIDALNKTAESALFFLTIDEKLEQQIAAGTEKENERIEVIGRALRIGGMEQAEIGKIIELRYKDTLALERAIRQGMYGVAAKEALTKVSREHTAQMAKETGEQDKLSKGMNTFASAEDNAAKALERQNKLMAAADKLIDKAEKEMKGWIKTEKDADKGFNALNNTLKTEAIIFRAGGSAADWFKQNLAQLGQVGIMSANKMRTAWVQALDKFMTKWGDTLEITKSTMGAIDAAINQSYQNKSNKMDKDYQKQLENIKNSKMSEQEKNEAIVALDAEYGMKRQELAKKQAEQQKATAIVTAVINVAQAVTKALTGAIPPFNYILAAMTAAAGMIQIAAIKSATIPLAKGAIFKRPTITPGINGRDYQLGDVPSGEPELVVTGSAIREAIFGKNKNAGMGKKITLILPIYIGGRMVQRQVIDMIESASDRGDLRIASKSVN